MTNEALDISINIETGGYIIHTEAGHEYACERREKLIGERWTDDLGYTIDQLTSAIRKWREDHPEPNTDEVLKLSNLFVDYFTMGWMIFEKKYPVETLEIRETQRDSSVSATHSFLEEYYLPRLKEALGR